MKLMWAELNFVQEVRDIMESDCVLHQFDMPVNLLNKSVNVWNGFTPTRKYEHGIAFRTRKYE